MPRSRLESTKDLPANLYVNSAGYFYYKHPVTKKTIGLKRDRAKAIEVAISLNEQTAPEQASLLEGRFKSIASNRKFDVDGLMTADFLRENCAVFEKVCGIYFLLQDGAVMYIGQSINCNYRISVHISERKKQFNSCYIVRAEPGNLNELEALYIKKFRPACNLLFPKHASKDAWWIEQSLN